MKARIVAPVLHDPFSVPDRHHGLQPGRPVELVAGRRPPLSGQRVERLRAAVEDFRRQGYPGTTRTSAELLAHWRRPRARMRPFFAQLEAVETVVLLAEAPQLAADDAQVPRMPGCDFERWACHLATGAGKTHVMAMLIAWNLLNHGSRPGDPRFAPRVLVLCPNVTVRDRLQVLQPAAGEASLYRSADLVPAHLWSALGHGQVVITNWHRLARRGLLGSAARERVHLQGSESDAVLARRVLGRGRGPLMVLNDEAHHAHAGDPASDGAATVWLDGLLTLDSVVGVRRCVDLTATPFEHSGSGAPRHFPFVVSEYGLADAIEAGLVKAPQPLEVEPDRGYVPLDRVQLHASARRRVEQGGHRLTPDALVAEAAPLIRQMLRSFEESRREAGGDEDSVAGVLLIVCADTRLSKAVCRFLLESADAGDGAVRLFREQPEHLVRVDTRVLRETDASGQAADAARWQRHVIDTVGRTRWPRSRRGHPLRPAGFAALARRLHKPLHPPGRDVRCVVSVGMLSEGWDCPHVTHVLGLRPFSSSLLCEQVVGRSLRRRDYVTDRNGRLPPERAIVCGIPFDSLPVWLKQSQAPPQHAPGVRVVPRPDRARLAMQLPAVIGFGCEGRLSVRVDFDALQLPPGSAAPSIPRRAYRVTAALTRQLSVGPHAPGPAHALFPLLLPCVAEALSRAGAVGQELDAQHLQPHLRLEAGASRPLPRYRPGDFLRTRDVDHVTREPTLSVDKSHLGVVLAAPDSPKALLATRLDADERVCCFVDNELLGCEVPLLDGGRPGAYRPTFIARLAGERPQHVALGLGPITQAEIEAAERWADALDNDGVAGGFRFCSLREASSTYP